LESAIRASTKIKIVNALAGDTVRRTVLILRPGGIRQSRQSAERELNMKKMTSGLINSESGRTLCAGKLSAPIFDEISHKHRHPLMKRLSITSNTCCAV